MLRYEPAKGKKLPTGQHEKSGGLMYEQMECGEVCKRFHTDEKAGLTQQEAEKRLKADGKNRLKKVREETTIDRIQNS